MDETPSLTLPYIVAAQALKHVTHNEALRMLDAVVQLSALDRDLTAPPGSPVDGDRYIIAASSTGAWTGKDNQVAAWQDNAWAFYTPNEGWLAWVADEDKLLAWDGAAWNEVSGGGSINPTPLVGINTTADTTNRLAVKSDAVLFSHDDVTPGSGDIRTKLNKAQASGVASFLFQDNFSGRAEIGLVGDDDFHFKVSPDGTSWRDAIIIDDITGRVSFPHTPQNNNLLINGDFAINQRAFAGGALIAGAYGHDRWKADASGASYSLSGGVVALDSGALVQVIESPELAGEVVTLSVGDLTGGNMNIDIEGQTGTITAAAGRAGATLTVPVGSTGNITVKITPATVAVTFKQVKLEHRSVATQFVARNPTIELVMCQRYYRIIGGGAAGAWYNSTSAQVAFSYQKMRSSPSLTLLTTTGVIAEPGIANRTASSGTLSPNSLNDESATLNFGGFSGANAGTVALTVTNQLAALSAEL